MRREEWRFDRTTWEVDEFGVGRAVYRARGPRRTYCLVAFAHDLPADQRSDRVIATSWDATFCLYDGEPTKEDLDRLQDNVPKQEAGRVSDRELSLSRANRSVRLWDHVVERLANGQQPDITELETVGYLMRTTAVYGSGKFGAADRAMISDRPFVAGPFHIEMLSVYLTRAFTVDLVEHMAAVKGGRKATKIEPHIRRCLGVGNSTGLGMAPFLINHPVLLNNWILARENALARVRAVENVKPQDVEHFGRVLERAALNVSSWHSQHELQIDKLNSLNEDIEHLQQHIADMDLRRSYLWDEAYRWVETNLSEEGQELFVSLVMEPYGDIIDSLSQDMDANEEIAFPISGNMSLGDLCKLIETEYSWSFDIDPKNENQRARFWYVSQEKLEPRLGDRFSEPGVEYELPYDIGHGMQRLYHEARSRSDSVSVADFLLVNPQYRHLVRRVQLVSKYPYAEIRDNLVSSEMLPIDILRCKLAFFGATKFDPRSDRWIRICMYQGAPYPHELSNMPEDDWAYPEVEA